MLPAGSSRLRLPLCSEAFQGAPCRVLPSWDPCVAPQCLPFLSTSSRSSWACTLGTLLVFLLFSGFLVSSPGHVPRLPVLSSPELYFRDHVSHYSPRMFLFFLLFLVFARVLWTWCLPSNDSKASLGFCANSQKSGLRVVSTFPGARNP